MRLLSQAYGLALTTYIPIAGGAVEIAALYLFWCAVIEAGRTARPLRCEPLLWTGMGLALVAPVVEFLRYVAAWRP